MPAGPVGSVWASGTWSNTCWEANTWANASPPSPATLQITAAKQSYRKRKAPIQYRPDWFDIEYGNVQRGVLPLAIRAVTVSTTASVDDGVILCDPTSGAITVTLPNPIRVQFMAVTIKQVTSAAHTVTIGGTVDGTANPVLGGVNSAITVASDGAHWWKTGSV